MKFFHALTDVLFDGVRSAEPPTSSGSASAVALSTAPNAARVATLPFSFVNVGIFASQFGRQLAARAAARAPSRRPDTRVAYAAHLRVPLRVLARAALLRLPPVRERFVGHEERLDASASRSSSS